MKNQIRIKIENSIEQILLKVSIPIVVGLFSSYNLFKEGNFNEAKETLGILGMAFSFVIIIVMIYFVYQSFNQAVILEDNNLIVQEFAQKMYKWDDIKGAKIEVISDRFYINLSVKNKVLTNERKTEITEKNTLIGPFNYAPNRLTDFINIAKDSNKQERSKMILEWEGGRF